MSLQIEGLCLRCVWLDEGGISEADVEMESGCWGVTREEKTKRQPQNAEGDGVFERENGKNEAGTACRSFKPSWIE